MGSHRLRLDMNDIHHYGHILMTRISHVAPTHSKEAESAAFHTPVWIDIGKPLCHKSVNNRSEPNESPKW